ncbi:DNA polymerase III subunit gamma/tau, partial [Escherichia coli]
NCREIEQGRFVDLIEIDAASRTKVEDTRDLLDNVQYAPARGRFKVYLIDEVHMLSRHSFNALLKTLEEPPEHVKFLLATTDPQKLPVTILSRCLQFHLKALDVEQIRHQLEHILNEEHTDQAIASGDGQVSTQAVSAMLGTLDDDQALSLVEAMVEANGERVMALINEAAARGIEWEALLVEMLGLLHRIAMVQLSPAALGNDMAAIELRMRELARTIPPTDIQLYYQTLLIGRKELPYAPDRRMGVEMTLLRALAFHPRMPLPEPEVPRQSFAPVAPTAVMTPTQVPPQPQSAPQQAPTVPLPETTSQVLAARQQLQRVQGATKAKKSEPAAATRARPVNNAALERLASVTDRVQARPVPSALEKAPAKKEAYRWKATTPVMQQKEVVATPKALKKALEHEKTPELAAKLAAEAIERDPWAAQVSQLSLPKLVEQVALNAWKEESDNAVCLHLRSSQRHLNNRGAQQKLAEALSTLKGSTVELTIVEDDNPAVRTPLEWRQAIYEEKLAQARESIIADNNIQTLRRFFDAELDEESIRPI